VKAPPAECQACGEGCVRCRGVYVDTGEARVMVGLTANEMVELVHGTTDARLREHLLRAISLVDPERERQERAELAR
jgi:Zn-finger nucleic acid-binding protein